MADLPEISDFLRDETRRLVRQGMSLRDARAAAIEQASQLTPASAWRSDEVEKLPTRAADGEQLLLFG